MTKSLTEQWREGTLSLNYYYIKLQSGKYGIDHTVMSIDGDLPKTKFAYSDFATEEVLAPVPSYDKWKCLQERNEKLEKMAFHYTPEEWNTMMRMVERLKEQQKEPNVWREIITDEDYQELVERCHKLQEQLNEARHTIYCIANTDGSDCKTILETIIRDANLYLEKWGIK